MSSKRKGSKSSGAKGGAVDPYIAALLSQGQRLHHAGDLSGAEAQYLKAHQIDPKHPDILFLLGVVAFQSGRADSAIDRLSQAVRARPAFPEARIYLGLAYREAARLDEAAKCFEAVLKTAPDSFDAAFNLANLRREQDRLTQALPHYKRAAMLRPNDFDTQSAFVDALIDAGQIDDAVFVARAVADRFAQTAQAHLALGVALKLAKRPAEAMDCYLRALALEPDNAIAHHNLGNTYKDLGRFEEAERHYRQAIAIDTNFAEVHTSLGWLLAETGLFESAHASYDRALALEPSHPEILSNLAMLELLEGDFQNGWAHYESRLRTKQRHHTPFFKGERWRGAALTDRSLAISTEQGIGDEIMFASLLADLPMDAREVFLECDDRLLPIYERSFPRYTLIGRSARVKRPHDDPGVDYQIPLASLGMVLRPARDSFKPVSSFLQADADRVARLRQTYLEWSGGRPIIGITWKSSNSALSLKKSTTLEQWTPVLSHPDAIFVTLQYGDVAADIDAFTRSTGIRIFKDETIDPFSDIDGLAAQIAALDGIVSISNATAHLAGALGTPVLLAIPAVPDWRWQIQGDASVWYQSIRLFRQPMAEDWRTPIDRIASALPSLF